MKRAFVLLLLAAALAACTSTRPPVVPALQGKPRVPINKQQPTPINSAPASSVDQSEGE